MTDLNDRLCALKGDIFDLDEEAFDAAVVFVKSGYNCLYADLMFKENKLEKSRIGYIVFTDVRRMPFYHPFKPYLSSFQSQAKAEEYVREVVNLSLGYAIRVGKRIAFHGVQIRGMDEIHNENVTIEAVKEWLERNPNASVTLVDKFGSFNSHFIELLLSRYSRILRRYIKC